MARSRADLAGGTRDPAHPLALGDIRIRDPFLVPDPAAGDYLLVGSTDEDVWSADEGVGFDAYRSRDLATWEGPIPVFRPPAGFWSPGMYWAPEIHQHRGRWYLLATFAGPERRRGTQILVADSPLGPFALHSDGPVTPANWECLDGTLHVDEDGEPWLVFCQEWLQVHDGAVWAQRLTDDLRSSAAPPVFLFNASAAPWARPLVAAHLEHYEFPLFITDGPFLHRTSDGALLMLWSSQGEDGYAMGVAHSSSGTVVGPWVQEPEPLWGRDGGHGMVARLLDGSLALVLHQPNDTPNERAVVRRIVEAGGTLRLTEAGGL